MARRSLLVVSAVLAVTLVPSLKARAAEPESPEKARNERLCRLLGEAREGKPALGEVRLAVMGASDTGVRMLVLYGDGLGFWNRERQFRVDQKFLRDLLTTIAKAGYCDWPEKAHLIGNPEAAKKWVKGSRASRTVSLTIGDVSKSVTQNPRAPESTVFTAFVKELLDACQKDGEKGVATGSLADALAKLRDGALDPRALTLTINCPQQAAGDPEGWVLHLRGTEVETQRNTKAAGYADRRTVRVSEKEVRDLAALLLTSDVAGLPANIVAPGYSDFGVTVLNRSASIQARAFAGTSASTRPQAQAAFAKVREALYALYERTRETKAGAPS